MALLAGKMYAAKCGEHINETPKTLDELISQCQEWDGQVVKVVPYFRSFDVQPGEYRADRLDYVSISILPTDEKEGEYEIDWRLSSTGWVLAGDGAGDPCTNGGSVLTGRDLG